MGHWLLNLIVLRINYLEHSKPFVYLSPVHNIPERLNELASVVLAVRIK